VLKDQTNKKTLTGTSLVRIFTK